MVTDWRAWRASAMAMLVMLAGILFLLQRDWRSLLARLWKSMAAFLSLRKRLERAVNEEEDWKRLKGGEIF